MELGLHGTRALVTGSTRGIGRAIARKLLDEGASVIVHGRRPDTVDPAVAELSDHGEVRGIAADLSDPGETDRLCATVDDGRTLDVLVNNAAIFEPVPFDEADDEAWRRHLDVNLMGPVRLSRYWLPRMIARDAGSILMIASEAGVKPVPYMVPYSVTKTALIGLGRALAERTQGTAVRVNTLLPGPTLTGNVRQLLADVAEERGLETDQVIDGYFEAEEPTSLLQRFEDPEEVAGIAVFLCSDAARVVRGAAWRAEGGIIRSIT